MSLQAGDVAIVTGAGRGLGQAIARRLAADGAKVGVWDIDQDAANATAESIRSAGGTALAISADVSKIDDVRRAISQVESQFGSIEVMVNNAGYTRHMPLLEVTQEDWHRVLDVCLLGAFNCTQCVAPTMIRNGYGRIINISSRTALGDPGQAPYVAAKAGLNGLTRALALELAGHGVTVNCVAPGMIRTERVMSHANYDKMNERSRERTWIKRDGVPEDIASAVAFFAGRENGFVTGEVLYVAGGRLAS